MPKILMAPDGAVDFHAHILPGADHGSDSLETSLFQLEQATRHGIRRIVATPHFYPVNHEVDSFLERRTRAYNLILESCTENLPQIKLGAEVLICNSIERLPGLERLFIEGTNTLLLELPFNDFQPAYCASVEYLVKSGVEVIIAHAERYSYEHIEQVLSCGARLQLNPRCIVQRHRRGAVIEWFKKGQVAALGSDIHGRDKKAYPLFCKAFSILGIYSTDIVKDSSFIFNSSGISLKL